MRHRIVIHENGEVKAIYADGLIPYINALRAEFGLPAMAVTIERASYVEPAQVAGENVWRVDMSPVGGGIYYSDEQGNSFKQRQAALDFELQWLREHWLMKESPC